MRDRARKASPVLWGGARAVLLAAIAAACLCGYARAQDGPARSLAVVETSAELVPLSLLVQARLSEKGLVLVERGELDRILQEQELSAAGLASPDALVKVGALLRADGFLLLSLEEAGPPLPVQPTIPGVQGAAEPPGEGGKLVRLRLTETAHGIRLLDWFVAWDPKKAEEAAAEAVAKVSEVAPKLKLPAGQVIPIGIVDVHRVQLDQEYQWACRAVVTMLSARLSKEPRVVMLEREDLRRMLDETLLTRGQDAEFWRSGVLIEGYMQRAGKERIELKLQCRRPGGEELPVAPLAVDVEKLQEAVEESAQSIVAAVTNAPPAAAWDPAKEAEEFFRQGDLLKNHGRYAAARPVLETASALDPAKLEYADALLWPAVCEAMPGVQPRVYTDAELAELVARVIPLARKAIIEPPGLPYDSANPVWSLHAYFGTQSSVATESIREANRKNRKIAAEMYERTMRTSPLGAVPANTLLPESVLSRSNTPAEGLENLKEAIRRVVMPRGEGGQIASDSLRAQACCDFLRGLGAPQHLADWDNTFASGLLAQLEELSEARDPITRFFGGIAIVRCCGSLQGLWPSGAQDWQQRAAWQERTKALFARFGRDRLARFVDKASEAFLRDLRGGQDLDVVAKRNMITELLEAMSEYSVAYPPENRIMALETIYGDLIERGDVDSLVYVQSAPGADTAPVDAESDNTSPEVVARSLRLLERTGAALRARADSAAAAKALRRTRQAANRVRDDLTERIQQLQSRALSADREGFAAEAQALRRRIAELRQSFPELRPKAPPAGLSVRMLLRAADWPQPWDFSWTTWRCIVPDPERPVAWVASSLRGPQDTEVRAALAGLDVRQKSVVALWQTASKRTHYSSGDLERAPAVVIGERKSYVAVEGLGLVEFPGSAAAGKGSIDTPRLLGPQNSLPPACITGIAPDGNKLWIAYSHNGSGLGIYDPDAEEWETVLSSEVRGDRPFQDGARYEFRELTPVPGGLMFFAYLSTLGGGTSPWGAWRLDAHTGALQPLFRLEDLHQVSSEGRDLWAAGPRMLAQLMSESSEIEIIFEDRDETLRSSSRYQSAWTIVEHPFVPVQEQERLPFGMEVFNALDLSTAAVHGDELWARYGKSQIIVLHRGKRFEDATVMDNDILEGGKVLQFFETPYGLIAVGEGSVGLIEGNP